MAWQPEALDQPGLYIGGLRHDLHPAKLAGLICNLLRNFQVQVAKHSVHISFKPNTAFAIVDLPDIAVSRHLLSQLASYRNVRNAFDLEKITSDPSHFKVGPKLTEGYRQRSRSRSKSRSRSRPPEERDTRATSYPERRGSNVKQNLSNHSVDSPGRYRSRSRSGQGNSGERAGVQSTSNTAAPPSYHHPSADTSAKPPKSKRAARRERKRNRSKLREASASHSNSSVNGVRNQSKSSRRGKKSLNNSSLSKEEEEDDDDDDDDDDNDSAMTESDSSLREGVSETSLFCIATKPQAKGVQRLIQESSRDPLSRSASEGGVISLTKTSATTSTTGLPLPSHVSVTTSTPGAGTSLESNFYRQGQTIGRETRHSEFKQGGGASVRCWLPETVGKYVCGFLNSSEGGTLYIGVNDEGVAVGITCSQSQEDDYRLLIDEALKSIDPPIFTDVYAVRFIPLMESTGLLSRTLQVLEVEVKAVKSNRQLYVFRANAFLRRDGSLQGPLKARQVQEWTRMRLEKDSSSSLLKTQLREMTSQLESERQKTAQMQEQLSQLEVYITEVKLGPKKSKICAVM